MGVTALTAAEGPAPAHPPTFGIASPRVDFVLLPEAGALLDRGWSEVGEIDLDGFDIPDNFWGELVALPDLGPGAGGAGGAGAGGAGGGAGGYGPQDFARFLAKLGAGPTDGAPFRRAFRRAARAAAAARPSPARSPRPPTAPGGASSSSRPPSGVRGGFRPRVDVRVGARRGGRRRPRGRDGRHRLALAALLAGVATPQELEGARAAWPGYFQRRVDLPDRPVARPAAPRGGGGGGGGSGGGEWWREEEASGESGGEESGSGNGGGDGNGMEIDEEDDAAEGPEGPDFLSLLPPELWRLVLSRLSPFELRPVRLACSALRRFADESESPVDAAAVEAAAAAIHAANARSAPEGPLPLRAPGSLYEFLRRVVFGPGAERAAWGRVVARACEMAEGDEERGRLRAALASTPAMLWEGERLWARAGASGGEAVAWGNLHRALYARMSPFRFTDADCVGALAIARERLSPPPEGANLAALPAPETLLSRGDFAQLWPWLFLARRTLAATAELWGLPAPGPGTGPGHAVSRPVGAGPFLTRRAAVDLLVAASRPAPAAAPNPRGQSPIDPAAQAEENPRPLILRLTSLQWPDALAGALALSACPGAGLDQHHLIRYPSSAEAVAREVDSVCGSGNANGVWRGAAPSIEIEIPLLDIMILPHPSLAYDLELLDYFKSRPRFLILKRVPFAYDSSTLLLTLLLSPQAELQPSVAAFFEARVPPVDAPLEGLGIASSSATVPPAEAAGSSPSPSSSEVSEAAAKRRAEYLEGQKPGEPGGALALPRYIFAARPPALLGMGLAPGLGQGQGQGGAPSGSGSGPSGPRGPAR
eukprot:tig00021435_g21407.t1